MNFNWHKQRLWGGFQDFRSSNGTQLKILAFSQNDAYSMHFDNVNLTRPCRLVSRNARKMGTTHGRTQQTTHWRGRWGKYSLLLLRAIFTEGRGTSSIFVLRRYLLFITRWRGGGERKEEVWGITWFSLLPESIQTGLWTNYQEGGEGGGVIRMLQNFMGDQVNFNDTTKILQPSPGDKYWTVT